MAGAGRLQAVRRTARQATGRTLGRGQTAPGRRGTPPWAALPERVGGTWSCFGQSGGRPDGPPVGRQRATGWTLGRGWAALAAWMGGTWSRLRAVSRTAKRATSGPSRRQRCRILGRGRAAPARYAAAPWAALRLPMCPARTQSAPCAVLQIRKRLRIWGAPGRAGGRHLVTAPCSPGGRPDGPPTGRAEGSGAGCSAMAWRLQRGALRRPGWLWQ